MAHRDLRRSKPIVKSAAEKPLDDNEVHNGGAPVDGPVAEEAYHVRVREARQDAGFVLKLRRLRGTTQVVPRCWSPRFPSDKFLQAWSIHRLQVPGLYPGELIFSTRLTYHIEDSLGLKAHGWSFNNHFKSPKRGRV